MLSVSTSSSLADQAVVDHAVQLLRLVRLSAHDQLTIEHAIGLVSIAKNCTRARAAQILHKQAFPN
jgi:hypothetical protein